MIDEAALRRQYALLRPSLDERGRRLFAATQGQAFGRGGIAAVARATEIAPSTIGRGLKEIGDGVPLSGPRLRRAGTKKKELIGNYKNAGTDWCPDGKPRRVNVHDFEDKELGKAIPYGVYDLAENAGWVSVGVTHDTAQFAVQTIRRWWQVMGQARYPQASKLMITADGGGSNGSRVRLWKVELQKLADETGLTISVCHYPPGTSKWNKIEHRLFCHISQNWRARPLTSRLAVVELIAATTTKSGLTVTAELDTADYAKGIKVTDAEMDAIAMTRNQFHPEWNYTIAPKSENRALNLA